MNLFRPQVGLRWIRDNSAHRTRAASLPAHWDVSDHLVLRSHLHVPSHGHRAVGGKIPKRWIFHAYTHLLSKSLNNGTAICLVHLVFHTWTSEEVHTSCLPQLLAPRWEALWISCALVFHKSVRGIYPTNQVSAVHRGSASVWSPTISTVASLLREAACLKTKDLQVAGLQAVWRPLYPWQPACFWNQGDLGHLCLYQAIWSWSGVSRFLQNIVHLALASILILLVCEDTASLPIWPFRLPLLEALPLLTSTYLSSHSGSTVGISGTGPALYASTAFSSPLSSSSLFKHLSTALTSCGGYFAACWAMPTIKWMWRCHGAPPVLFVHSVSNSSANPGWFVIHPVSLRTKPVPCRPRRSVAVMPHLHIGPRTTYTSSLEDIRSTLSSFQLAESVSHTHHTMCGGDAMLLSFFSLISGRILFQLTACKFENKWHCGLPVINRGSSRSISSWRSSTSAVLLRFQYSPFSFVSQRSTANPGLSLYCCASAVKRFGE